MSHATRAGVLILAVTLGCGGKKPSATGPAEPADDCEPGRCLEDISGRVEDRRPEARACYEAGHAVDPTLEGRVVINFEIDPSGTVVDASQSAQDEQITDEAVVECIVEVIKGIKFAESGRGKSTKAFHRYEFNAPRK